MRGFISGLVLAVVGAMTFGCSSDTGAKSGMQSGTQPDKAGDTKACVMQSDGRDVLRLTVPADAKCAPKDGWLHMSARDRYVDVWLVRGAKTVEEAVGRVDQEIAHEFKGFKAAGTTALTVAGAPAKRLNGSGTEADDGDPGTADVIVFKTGEHIFVACTHGEHLTPADGQWMLTVVQTAQAP